MIVLSPQECRRLLRLPEVGRVAFEHHGRIVVLPVTYGTDDDGAIVFRTARGLKLHHAADEQQPVAFEVDVTDADTFSGWSVLVRGRMRPVLDLTEMARLERRGVPRWLGDLAEQRWIRIDPSSISGRRVVASRASVPLRGEGRLRPPDAGPPTGRQQTEKETSCTSS